MTNSKGVDTAQPVQGCAAGIGPLMASVAKWSKAPVCGTGDHGFESRRSPHASHISRACSSTDRVLGFGPRGCGFESRQARQFLKLKWLPWLPREPLILGFANQMNFHTQFYAYASRPVSTCSLRGEQTFPHCPNVGLIH